MSEVKRYAVLITEIPTGFFTAIGYDDLDQARRIARITRRRHGKGYVVRIMDQTNSLEVPIDQEQQS